MSKDKGKAQTTGSAEGSKRESFEEAFGKLEGIVEKLENASLPLEDSIKAFEEGVRLTRLCKQTLDEAERKIELLLKEPDGSLRTQPFPDTGEAEGGPPAAPSNGDDIPF